MSRRVPRGRRVGSIDPARTHRTVERTPPMHGGYTFLEVIPNVEAAAARLERALTLTSALAELDASNECEHGGLSSDQAAQPGCTPVCPGYPRALRPTKLVSVPNGRSIGTETGPDGLMQTILCACGRTWTRRAVRGRVPKCPTCRGETTQTLTKE